MGRFGPRSFQSLVISVPGYFGHGSFCPGTFWSELLDQGHTDPRSFWFLGHFCIWSFWSQGILSRDILVPGYFKSHNISILGHFGPWSFRSLGHFDIVTFWSQLIHVLTPGHFGPSWDISVSGHFGPYSFCLGTFRSLIISAQSHLVPGLFCPGFIQICGHFSHGLFW